MAASSESSEEAEPSLEDFIRSFQRPGAAISPEDVISLKELILSCDLISGISEDLYLELLYFLVDYWADCCADISIKDVPILKYTNQYRRVTLCSIGMVVNRSCEICMSSDDQHNHWLSIWNVELKGASNFFFIPESTQMALKQFPKREKLCSWMREHLGIVEISLYDFSHAVLCNLQSTNDIDLVVGFTHFLYHSLSKKYITEEFVSALCESMPVVDNYGSVIMARNGALVPASVSKWVELACSNLWKGGNYIQLGENYFRHGYYVGECAGEDQILEFLQRCGIAIDIPDICPPDAILPVASSPLSKGNALLLLEWIRKATINGTMLPSRFLRSIQEGKWLKTSLGYKSPSESFLCTSEWGFLLHVGSVIEDIPLVDETFYGSQISEYLNELERLGVVSDVEECCLYITHMLMAAATISALTKDHVLSLLRFIRYVAEKKIAYEGIMRIFRGERWLKTSKGFRSPVESVMSSKEWEAFQQISDLPFVDEAYYSEEIHFYEDELKQLGVATGFDKRYEIIIENFRLSTSSALTVSSSILILECVRHSRSSSCFIDTIREQEWIKTNLGYRSPKDCFLYDPGWGCLLQWAGVPLIDEPFYGNNIRSYINELGIAGVSITSEGAYKNATHRVKLLLCSPSLTKEASVSLLECCKQLRMNGHPLRGELKVGISEEKWLKTCLGCRSPCESAIYDSGWEPISQITNLPFIDQSYYGEGIYSYVDELNSIGVVVKYYMAFQLVVAGFKFPKHKSLIAAGVVISLLECIRYQLVESLEEALPADFLRCIRGKKWLKTCMGFRSPVKCFLYDSDWEHLLRREDAPFIDESFYGPEIASYWKELGCIGVKVRVGSGCQLLSQCLRCHTDFSAIVRIYSYLHSFNWEPEPEEKSECWIWIPNENFDAGEWVSGKHCVLRMVDYASSSTLKVLERYYDIKLLPFFSTAFGVGLHHK